jgi:hypothetical protein
LETNREDIKEFVLAGPPEIIGTELKTLYDLKVIDYKVIGMETFNIGFTDDFRSFSKTYKDKLLEESKNNMLMLMQAEPERIFDMELATTMFYATIFFAYLETTRQMDAIDVTDEEVAGGLVARLKEINETFYNFKLQGNNNK